MVLSSSMVRPVLQIALLAAVYLAWAMLGIAAVGVSAPLAPAWSPAGIGLAALLLGGNRLWPGVALGALLAAVWGGVPLGAACTVALANTLEALLGTWLLRRVVGFQLSLERTRDIVGLVTLAAVFASAVGGTIGTTGLWLAGVISGAGWTASWWAWWLRCMMGKLVVTPLVLTWGVRGWSAFRPVRTAEGLGLTVALAGVSALVFTPVAPTGSNAPLAYYVFPFVGWAALRFGQRGVTSATFLVATIATWGTLAGGGPFARGTPHETLPLLHAFLGALALTGLGLAAVIARRRRSEAALEQRTRQIDALRTVGIEMTRELDLSALLALITRHALELVGAGTGAVWLWNEAAQKLDRQTWHGLSEWTQGWRLDLGEGVVGTVAQRREGMLVNDYRTSPYAHPGVLARSSVTAVLAEPLLYQERLLGVLAVNDEGTGRRFTEEDRRLLGLLAAHAATAIERARLHTETERRRREAEAIAELARTVNKSLELGKTLERVAEAARSLCASDSARILLWDPAEDAMVPRYFAGDPYPGWDALRIRPGRGLGGQALLTGRPVRTDNYDEDPRITKDYLPSVQVEGAIAQMAVPIRSDGHIDGLLYVSNLAARPFTDRDEEVLVRLADHAAIALRNARLYAESQARGERLQTLARVTRTVAESLEIESVLHDVAQAVLALVPGGVCDLWTVQGKRVRLGARAGARSPDGATVRDFQLGEGMIGRVCQSGEPLSLEDIYGSPFVARPEALHAEGLVSVAGLPLRAGGTIIGALFLFTKERHTFTVEEMEALALFAEHAAVAIEKSYAFRDAKVRRKRLATLIDVTRELARGPDLPDVLDAIVEAAATLFEGEAGLRLLQDDVLVRVAATPGALEVMRSVRLPLGAAVIAAEALKANRAMVVADTEHDPRILPENRAAIRPDRTGALLCLPVRLGPREIGTLHIYRERGHVFDDDDVTLATSLADAAAIAIENARLFRDSERRRTAAESLAGLQRVISQSLDADVVAQRTVDALRRLLQARRAALHRIDPGTGDVVVVTVADDAAHGLRPGAVIPRGTGVVGLAIRERRSVVSSNLLLDERITHTPELRDLHEKSAYRAVLAVPLIARGHVIGVLGVGSAEGRGFDAEEIRLAEAFADQVVMALENARLFAEMERSRREAEELAHFARKLTENFDIAAVAERVVEGVLRVFAAHASGLRLLGPDGALVAVAMAGASKEHFEIGHVMRLDECFPGRAVAEGRPWRSRDILADPEAVRSEDIRRRLHATGHRGALSVPLRVKDKIIGVISIADRMPRDFSDAEVALLQAFADQAALAVDSARLFEDDARKLDELSVLYETSRALAGHLEVEQIVQTVHDQAGRILDAREMVIVLLDEGRAAFESALWMADGRREPGSGRRYPLDFGLVSRVIARREPIRTDSYREACLREGVAPDPETLPLPHWLGVPMVARDQTVGAIVLRAAGRPFTEADERILANIAGVAALAIAGAQLFEERVRAHREVEAAHAQIVRSERLRALGEMAAGVAHDFNNTLAAIAIHADLMGMETADPALTRHLKVIQRAALDGGRTVRRVQEFTRLRRARPFQSLNLNQVIDEVVELTRPRWRDAAQAAGLTYEVTVEPAALPPVAGDPSELREVLTNLVFNALDAMPAGGRLAFRTGVEAGRVFCAVADTGVGMPAEARTRVFDPFFTTKSEKGSGLGLSIVYGIVTRHGGEIEIASEVGQGSVFTLRFPVAAPMPEAPRPPAPPGGSPPSRVLVVDDEPVVRAALSEVLAAEGHAVTACADGPAALERFREEAFDLVVTDLSMPGMSGWELAGRVKAQRPETPVLLITGWGDQIDPAEARAKGVDRVLAKPFTRINLVTLIVELIAPQTRRPGAALRNRPSRGEDRGRSRAHPGVA